MEAARWRETTNKLAKEQGLGEHIRPGESLQECYKNLSSLDV